jgi:hypothetical protein
MEGSTSIYTTRDSSIPFNSFVRTVELTWAYDLDKRCGALTYVVQSPLVLVLGLLLLHK